MRIIKLSPDIFSSFQQVQDFFLNVLPSRTPPGKFLIPPRHIAKKNFDADEDLLFTYRSRVVFKARSQSPLQNNKNNKKYPYYFVVDLSRLQGADRALKDVEQRYKKISRKDVRWAGQGWNMQPESAQTSALWSWL